MTSTEFDVKHSKTPVYQLLALWLITALLFFPSTLSLWNQWAFQDTGYSHGTLILGVVIYLIIHHQAAISAEIRSGSPCFLFFPLVLLGSASWALVYLMDIQLLQWLILPGMLFATTGLIFGARTAFKTFPSLLFFYLAIPIWEALIPSLQHISVIATDLLLQLFSIPAKISGIEVSVPYGNFIIADGCSGLRYFLVALTLSLLYGYLYYTSMARRTLLVIAALAIGVAFNWIRIFLIIYIGYRTKMESSLVHDHETFGWVLFAFALIPIFFIAHLLTPKAADTIPTREASTSSSDTNSQSAATNHPSATNHQAAINPAAPHKQRLLAFAVTGLCIGIGPASVYYMKQQPIVTPNFYPIHTPFDIGEWSRIAKPSPSSAPLITAWQPDFVNTSQSSDTYFSSATQRPIHLSMQLYFQQTQGAELVFYNNHIYQREAWRRAEQRALPFVGGELTTTSLSPKRALKEVPAQERSQSRRLLLSYYYLVADQVTHQKHFAKVLQLKALFEGRQDGALIGAAIECDTAVDGDCREAIHELLQFHNQLYQHFIMTHWQ